MYMDKIPHLPRKRKGDLLGTCAGYYYEFNRKIFTNVRIDAEFYIYYLESKVKPVGIVTIDYTNSCDGYDEGRDKWLQEYYNTKTKLAGFMRFYPQSAKSLHDEVTDEEFRTYVINNLILKSKRSQNVHEQLRESLKRAQS